MRTVIANSEKEIAIAISSILDRRAQKFTNEEAATRLIIEQVRKKGDSALFALAKKLDSVSLNKANIKISVREIDMAAANCSAKVKKAIAASILNIRRYHKKQKNGDFSFSPANGIRLAQRSLPVESVGLYIPGGVTPLFSTVLMTAVPAQVAGVKRIVVATPCRKGLDPSVAFSLKALNITEVYRIGGAQAVAALALGTRSVAPVDKIVGPGNIYVSLAKKILFGTIDIDMIAGPSEILVIADNTANSQYVTNDLLSQSEHGTGKESSILLTTSAKVATEVSKNIKTVTNKISKQNGFYRAISNFGLILVLKSIDECVRVANLIAPEHLEIATKDPHKILPLIRNAGAVFLGHYTCESVGDYYAGPSHVLPTNGTARFRSPLSTYDFMKRMSVIEYSKSALQKASTAIITMAEAEGLSYHAEAVKTRTAP